MPIDMYSTIFHNTIFHNAVLPSVVDDVKDRISIKCLQSCLGYYVGKNKEQFDKCRINLIIIITACLHQK